jgi:hypothetical protein
MTFEKVGEFSEEVILALNLPIPVGTAVLLSQSTLEHIKKDHPEITGDHNAVIADIIAAPSGVSCRPKDGSVGFYKEHENGEQYYLELSIRPSSVGEFFVRTLHPIKTKRFNWYVKKSKVISVDKFKNT